MRDALMERSGTGTFANWIRRVFDHPVTEPAWYWSSDSDTFEPEAPQCVAHLTELFEEPESALAPYSDAQIGQGLWYLVDDSCSNYMCSLTEAKVDWLPRRRGIRAIGSLFTRLFASRCSEHLSHRDEKGAAPLNGLCYMWWDLFPAHGRPADSVSVQLDTEVLAVMERTLALPSTACQESALHGLGHWQRRYPRVVQEAVDHFLVRAGDLRSELRRYALCARVGNVL
jgi:hypothetical protein